MLPEQYYTSKIYCNAAAQLTEVSAWIHVNIHTHYNLCMCVMFVCLINPPAQVIVLPLVPPQIDTCSHTYYYNNVLTVNTQTNKVINTHICTHTPFSDKRDELVGKTACALFGQLMC